MVCFAEGGLDFPGRGARLGAFLTRVVEDGLLSRPEKSTRAGVQFRLRARTFSGLPLNAATR